MSHKEKTRACEHVYKNMGAAFCPSCGGATHETNWHENNKAHEIWKIENKDAKPVWWSIQFAFCLVKSNVAHVSRY